MKKAVSQFIHRKLVEPIKHQLVQGTTPHALALSCALGVIFGGFPLLGTTTLLCLLVGIVFKLNQATIQAVNYFMYPVHLALIPVFIHWGARLTGSPPVHISLTTIASEFFSDLPGFLRTYGAVGLHAVFAWCLVAPFVGALVYAASYAAFNQWSKRRRTSGAI